MAILDDRTHETTQRFKGLWRKIKGTPQSRSLSDNFTKTVLRVHHQLIEIKNHNQRLKIQRVWNKIKLVPIIKLTKYMYKLIRNPSNSIMQIQGLLSIDCQAKTQLKQKTQMVRERY